MHGLHTVEKIGGTSMTRFDEVIENVIIGSRLPGDVYNRIFVVSAYAGITNLLLENKKNGAPGVWALFDEANPAWETALDGVRTTMIEMNRKFEKHGLNQKSADDFVHMRLDGIKACLAELIHLRSYGHFNPAQYRLPSREILAAVGEAHSAYNSTELLRAKGINAHFFDLTGWMDSEILSFDATIRRHFDGIDFAKVMPIVTGYVKFDEGIMSRYDRGYSEITFSKIATVTKAREGIIHKEFHLCSGDPILIGPEKVRIIGQTNFDIADQMADMEMEAIHSKASKEMELRNIPIRVKNAFEPDHEGTLISKNYVSPEPRVEMICSRSDVVAIEVFDAEMVGAFGYDHKLLTALVNHGISFICANTNANTICHYVPEKSRNLQACLTEIREMLPTSQVKTMQVGILSIMGSNMRSHGFLARAAAALSNEGINILGVDGCTRQVSFQFIVERHDVQKAEVALHRALIENHSHL